MNDSAAIADPRQRQTFGWRTHALERSYPPYLPFGWPVWNFLRPIIGGGGTQLAEARALAPKLQGRSLYCLRPLRPSLQDSSAQGVVGYPRRCLRRRNSRLVIRPLTFCRTLDTTSQNARYLLRSASPGQIRHLASDPRCPRTSPVRRPAESAAASSPLSFLMHSLIPR